MHILSFDPTVIRERVFEYLSNIGIHSQISIGVDAVIEWSEGSYHESKEARIQALLEHDLWELSSDLVMMICTLKDKVTLVTMASMLAPKLKLHKTDKFQAIYLAAEFICMFADSDIYDVSRQKGYSAYVIPRIELPQDIKDLICYSVHTPPCSNPNLITHNRDSIYTYQEGKSLILGGAINHHENHLCLDVLNTQSQVKFSINKEFINRVKETQQLDPLEYDEETYREIIHNWQEFLDQSEFIYGHMIDEGNSFAFQHRVDKRGRIYSHGYHINPMGSSYKKAMLDFTEELHIEVPQEYL